VQIKPQLEKLLNLKDDSLTKGLEKGKKILFFIDLLCVEIRLTQSLLKLFIEYQIPSDLLTYSGL
jgi:hypothetical protein